MDKISKIPVCGKVESFLAMPNDVYSINFNTPTGSKPIELRISVPSFSLITFDKNYGTFTVHPVNEYFDVDNVSKING